MSTSIAALARRVLLPVAVALVLLLALAWLLQRQLIYLPAGSPGPAEEVLPEAREVTIATADGLELAAWFVEAGPTAVAVFPGNAGHRGHRAPIARALSDAGLSVLLVDYRGYGGNPGRPTEEGLATDAEAAVAWLDARTDVERIVYLGESLGTAVATDLAIERPPAALVLRSPFTSLLEVARAHYGPVPGWLLREDHDTVGRIGAVQVPVLVLAVRGDEIVPFDQSRRVYAAADAPKRFVTLDASGHDDPSLSGGTEMIEAVAAFLREHGVHDGWVWRTTPYHRHLRLLDATGSRVADDRRWQR